jgi:4-hydroxy-4-methyl-2-oxoglutarate aldolase
MTLIDIAIRLSQLDACAVSDALDKLGLQGSVSGIHRYSTDRRISGRVVTVRLEKDDGRPVASRHLGTTAIEAAQPGDVIVLEQRTGIDAACWGGNLTLGAQLCGISGVIIEGPGRDMDEARQYDFPVFARDHTARTARGRIVETGTNVSITVGDVSVSPGDYVVADGSAVVFVPAAAIERVLDAAEVIAERERAMVTALREGTPISQVMGKSYETLLKKS